MSEKKLTAAEKIWLLELLYAAVLDGTESFEEFAVGADLAYLMGAIVRDSFAEWPSDRALLDVLAEQTAKDPRLALVWRFIKVTDRSGTFERLGPLQVEGTADFLGPCAACKEAFVCGDFYTAVRMGPGADPTQRKRAREGLEFESVVVFAHWACVTGEESERDGEEESGDGS